MGDGRRQIVAIVRDHEERLTGLTAIVLDDGLHMSAVGVVETVKGFVENEQNGVFDEGTSKEHKALLAIGERRE